MQPIVIISNKCGMYELRHELPYENLKTSYDYSLVLSRAPNINILSKLAKDPWKI